MTLKNLLHEEIVLQGVTYVWYIYYWAKCVDLVVDKLWAWAGACLLQLTQHYNESYERGAERTDHSVPQKRATQVHQASCWHYLWFVISCRSSGLQPALI